MTSKAKASNKSQSGNNTQRNKKKPNLVRAWGSDLGDKGTDKRAVLPRVRNPAPQSDEPSANELTLRAWEQTYAKRKRFKRIV